MIVTGGEDKPSRMGQPSVHLDITGTYIRVSIFGCQIFHFSFPAMVNDEHIPAGHIGRIEMCHMKIIKA